MNIINGLICFSVLIVLCFVGVLLVCSVDRKDEIERNKQAGCTCDQHVFYIGVDKNCPLHGDWD